MKKLEELNSFEIRDLRVKFGMKYNSTLNNLLNLKRYKVMLDDEYKRCVNKYNEYVDKFNNLFASDFGQSGYHPIRSKVDWPLMKLTLFSCIRGYKKSRLLTYYELKAVEEHMSKIENKI